MSQEAAGRMRVRVQEPKAEPDPARTGCLWIGGILGVIAGVLVTFFAVPSILDFLFPGETIAAGETYKDDKLTMRVAEVAVTEIEKEPSSDAAYLVRLEVTAKSSWSPSYDNFVLVLADETEIRARALLRRPDGEGPTRATVPQGESVLELLFANGEPALAPPDSLHLEEPAVKFALPEAVKP